MANKENETELQLKRALENVLKTGLADPNKILAQLTAEMVRLQLILGQTPDKEEHGAKIVFSEEQIKDIQRFSNTRLEPLPKNPVSASDDRQGWPAPNHELAKNVTEIVNLMSVLSGNDLSARLEETRSLMKDRKTQSKGNSANNLNAGTVNQQNTVSEVPAEESPIVKSSHAVFASDLGDLFKQENEQLTIKRELYDEVLEAMKAAAGGSDALKNTTANSIKTYLEVGSSIADIISILDLFGGTATTIGSKIGGLGASIGKFAGPVGLGAVAFDVVTTALDKLWKKTKEADLKKRFGDISLSVEQMNDIASRILASDNLTKIAKSFNAFKNLEQAKQEVKNLKEEIEKLDFKVSLGIELTLEEKESYIASVNKYLDGLQSYIVQQAEALNLGLSSLFSEADLEDNGFQATFNSITKKAFDTIGTLRTAFAEELEEGIDNINVTETAAKLLEKLTAIDQAVLNAKTASDYEMLMLEFNNGVGLSKESEEEFQRRLKELALRSAEAGKKVIQDNLAGMNFAIELADWNIEEGKRKQLSSTEIKALEAEKTQAIEHKKNYITGIKEGGFDNKIKEPLVKATQYQVDAFGQQYPTLAPIVQGKKGVNPIALFRSMPLEAQSNARDALVPINESLKLIEDLGYGCITTTPKVSDHAEMVDALGEVCATTDPEISDSAEMMGELGAACSSTTPELQNLTESVKELNRSAHVKGGGAVPENTIFPMKAAGTLHSPSTFIAGEKGAELITNMPGMTVYNAMETARILKSFKGLNTSAMVGRPTAMRTYDKELPNFDLPPAGEKVYKIDSKLNITVNGDIPGDLERQLSRHENRIIARMKEEIKSDERNKQRRSLI